MSEAAAYKYIFEYVPNKYSVTDESLRRVDAVEIKIGQSAKPGLGGHLPGSKVTDEIAAVRGFPAGSDIISPAHFPDITNTDELRAKVDELREATGGKPIGIKIAAGHIEADLEIALAARPDFITVDGRAGATGAAPKVVKDATAIPTIFALVRARAHLDAVGADDVSLVITGGFRNSADAVKALAMGADAVALASAALMAAGCQQYRICDTGKCPVGITTQEPELRARLKIDLSAKRVENFFNALTHELAEPLADAAEGDYRLSAASPCIDAGDNTAVPPDTYDLDNDGDGLIDYGEDLGCTSPGEGSEVEQALCSERNQVQTVS